MSSDTVPEEIANLIIRMEFLANAERGMKPCFSTYKYVYADSWYGSFYRRYYNESREKLLLYTQTVLEDLLRATQTYPQHRMLLIETAKRMKTGLENIQETYRGKLDVTIKFVPIFHNLQIIINIRPHS